MPKSHEIEFVCLRSVATVSDNGESRAKPMLVGFARAKDLKLIAKAPAFSEDDPNQAIAEMLQRLPVRKWQRPLDQPRIAEMAGFFNEGHLMPNPVLLAANPDLGAGLQIAPHGELVKLTIAVTPRAKRDGALWILDGQHRINALAASHAQEENPVPFVLLLDEGGSYNRAEFAAIFAQVTTKAKALEEPHHTWLEYSFELGNYEQPRGDARRRAFETIVRLGSDDIAVGTRTTNRFAGNIRFNPRNPERGRRPGVDGLDSVFAFPAQDFAKIVHEHYFKNPPARPLAPRKLAGQIALAYDALRSIIAQPHDATALFSPGNLYVQEGFIVGVLAYLRNQEPPDDWKAVLRRLGMDRGSWEFRGRRINTGGQHGRASRSAALGAFQHVFGQNHLPAPARDFVSYLLGDEATSLRLDFEDTAARGAPVHAEDIFNRRTLPLDGVLRRGRSLRIAPSPNIGGISIRASTRTPAYWTEMAKRARSRAGFPLDDLAADLETQSREGAITVEIWYELYGGEEASTEIIFT